MNGGSNPLPNGKAAIRPEGLTVRTRLLILVVLVSLASSSAFTASYQRIDGSIVDPIQNVSGGDHPYRRNNLEPSAILSSANLTNADLFNADLSFATLSFANLGGANLTSANLSGALLIEASLIGADLGGADLSGAGLVLSVLSGADLANANLFNADLSVANLTGTDLTGANLTGATMNALLSGANLSGASLANATHLALSGGAALYDLDTDFTGTGFDPVAAGWTLVPEPGTALLMGLGLAGLASRRR